MGCELGAEAEVDTDVIELSSTAQRDHDVSHPRPAGRDYLDTRSLNTRGMNVGLAPALLCLLSQRRSSSVATSAGISIAAPLLLALSRELERARMVVIKGRGARGAGVDSGRNVKGSTPSLPERSTDSVHAGGTIPVEIHVGEAEHGWRLCSARSACRRSYRRRCCCSKYDSDGDELGSSVWFNARNEGGEAEVGDG
jgi:hypothetical protein